MNRHYDRRPRANRWMALKYAGTCKVCGRAIPTGETAFYDYAAQTTTCPDLACCKVDGLTHDEWHGSPVSGRWVPTVSDARTGTGYVRDPGEDAADRWTETHS